MGDKYLVRLSKENGGKYYESIVEAESENNAFMKAVDEAELKGIILPDEIWTRISKLKKNGNTNRNFINSRL